MSSYFDSGDSDDEVQSSPLTEEEIEVAREEVLASKAIGDESFRNQDYNGALTAYTV
jgi:hypothetical protein